MHHINKLKHILVGSLAAWILWNHQAQYYCTSFEGTDELTVCRDDTLRYPIDHWTYVDGFDTKQQCLEVRMAAERATPEETRITNLLIINTYRCWPAGYIPTSED